MIHCIRFFQRYDITEYLKNVHITSIHELHITIRYSFTHINVYFQYGDIIALVCSSTKHGSALVKYQNKNDAVCL